MIRVFIWADTRDRADALALQLEEDERFEITELELADLVLCAGISRSRVPAGGKPLVAIGQTAEKEAQLDECLRAWLPPFAELEQISAALVAAAAGFTVLTGEQAKQTFQMKPAAVPDDRAYVEPLTARENEVLQMMAAGEGNKQIAAHLHISPNTAKFHVRQILGKLNADSRTEAVSLAIRRGLVPV